MQAGLNIGASMLSLKKPPGAVKRHHHAGPEVKDHRKFFLDVPPQVVAAAATRVHVYCQGALGAEGRDARRSAAAGSEGRSRVEV